MSSRPETTWTDSHCHLHDPGIPGGAEAAWEAARVAGVTRIVTIGTDAETSAAAADLAATHDGVWATAGLHPHDAWRGVETVLPFLDRPRIVAVGECGLDYHYDHSPREIQREAFAAQIAVAYQRRLPLVVHTREAWADTFDLLGRAERPDPVVFHCFTGSPDEARICLDLGAYVSFSGIVSFKGADDVRAAAALCPLDRLLVETDAPYLAPAPHRGRPNRPAYLPAVGASLAAATERDNESIAFATARNATVAFRLPST
ncbi:MAG TPA: TatD family hydrolase [Acidimicrobiales bacterium]|nr:TatD family hydrolase [Acidimicrobiales bacterium]